MRVAFFSTKSYDRTFFERANRLFGHDLYFIESRLTEQTAGLAKGCPAVCAFVNDELNAAVLDKLAENEVRLIAMRSAGFNNVDLEAAADLGLTVVRVPAYSPHSVAEHTVGLILALNRKLHRAYSRVREGNFSLDGLLGFELNGRTVGIVGTGKIGTIVGKILQGFGCIIIAYDPYPSDEARMLGFEYVPLDELLARSDIITLHAPLNRETYHMIDARAVERMKPHVMLINTSRGGLVDTRVVIDALKEGRIGSLGLDVYEEESDLFFQDLSGQAIQDDVFARLLTLPNVIITGHQAFFTHEALQNIARTTLANISKFERGETSGNEVRAVTAGVRV